MVKTMELLDNIHKSDADVLLFLLGPHWIKTPPLSLVYLENFLRQKGYRIKVIDLNIVFYRILKPSKKDWLSLNSRLETNILNTIDKKCEGLIEELVSQIADMKAKILGFSVYNRNRKATLDFASRINALNPSKTFIFGGPEILYEYHRKTFFEEINHSNSYFVLGEGELPLFSISRSVYENKNIEFNYYKDKKLIAYEEISNLDSLPPVDFDSLDIQLYDSKILPLLSSRGCIKRCVFCSECKLYKNFRQHSPEYIIALIKKLIVKHNITAFSFQDSLINANLKWLEEFCSLVIKDNLNLKWEAQIAVRSDMPKDLLKLMKSSGCYNLFVGLESGSGRILKSMNKGYDSQAAKIFLKNLYESGLQFEISLIAGFPDETEEDFSQTLSFIKDNKKFIPKIAQVNPFVEYPPAQINKTDSALDTVAKERVTRLIKIFDEEDIKYTSSFINNLTEQ